MRRSEMKKKLSLLLLLLSLFIIFFSRNLEDTGAILKDTVKRNGLVSLGNLQVTLLDLGDKVSELEVNKDIPRRISTKNSGETNEFVRLLVHPVFLNAQSITESLSLEEIAVIHSDWLKGEDGYYYYLKKLEPSKESAPIFEKINLTLRLKYGNLNLITKAEAITSESLAFVQAWWQGNTPNNETTPNLRKVYEKLNSVKD